MKNNVSRREFLKFAGVTAGAAVLAACAPAAAPTGAPATEGGGAPATKKPVELRFWTHANIALTDFVQKKIDEYKSVRPDVTIEYAFAEVADHEQRLFTSLAAGTGPDGFNMGDWNYPLLNTKDWLAPVDPAAWEQNSHEDLQNLFFDYSLTGLVRDGQMMAVPLEWNALDLYYNRAAYEEAGLDPDKPAQTWDEVTEYAIKMTKRDEVGNITFQGFQQSYGPGTEWTLKRIHPMLVQAGLDFLNEDLTRCAINTPEAIAILEYYTDWTTKHKVAMQGFEVPGVKGSPFRAGYSGMDLSGSYNVGSMKRANPDWEFGVEGGWDIAPFPQWGDERQKQDASAMWRWAAFVNKNSPNAEEMWNFIAFMLADVNEVNDEVGYIPSLKGWLDNEENYVDRPWLPVQKQDLEIGVPVPQTPKYQQLAQQILDMTERVYDGSQTVSESVAEACQKIDAILAEA